MVRGWVEPCVLSKRGYPTNHHWRDDAVHGEIITNRVTSDCATHFIVVPIDISGQPWPEIVAR
jgi:hypothetical protein